MGRLKNFKTVENETHYYGNTSSTISAICDENGEYEIYITGNGGAVEAAQAVERLMEIVGQTN